MVVRRKNMQYDDVLAELQQHKERIGTATPGEYLQDPAVKKTMDTILARLLESGLLEKVIDIRLNNEPNQQDILADILMFTKKNGEVRGLVAAILEYDPKHEKALPFENFIAMIAKNLAIDALRSRQRHQAQYPVFTDLAHHLPKKLVGPTGHHQFEVANIESPREPHADYALAATEETRQIIGELRNTLPDLAPNQALALAAFVDVALSREQDQTDLRTIGIGSSRFPHSHGIAQLVADRMNEIKAGTGPESLLGPITLPEGDTRTYTKELFAGHLHSAQKALVKRFPELAERVEGILSEHSKQEWHFRPQPSGLERGRVTHSQNLLLQKANPSTPDENQR